MNRRRFLKSILGLSLISGLGVSKGWSNTFQSQICLETVPITLNRLPGAFKRFKIALLSDLHSSPIVSYEHLSHAARLARNENPDLVVLTGDFIGHTLRTSRNQIHEFETKFLDNLVNALSVLKPKLGIYAVLGNHDFWSGPDVTNALVKTFEEKLKVQWLRNQHTQLNLGDDFITLLGVDDLWQRSFSLKRAMKGVDPKSTKILLSHNPEVNYRITPEYNIDLVLSGHTHGGQISFPFIGPPFHPGIRDQKYLRGLVHDENRKTYITRGVGHLIVPIRFNCPPEVTMLTLL